METSSKKLIRIGGWAGIIVPILFVVLVIIESLLRSGYSQISDEISYLGVGPYEIIQNSNFLITGILSIIFGLGLGATLSTASRVSKVKTTIATVILFGLGLIFAGITLLLASPYSENSPIAIEYYYLHTFASFVAFIAIIVAQFLTWRALRNNNLKDWRSFRVFSLVSGILSVNLLLVFLLTFTSDYKGLTERTFAAAPLVWIEIAGWKLFSVSQTAMKQITNKLV
ncbi:MAG TPA: DUF998 domain-containing protein [Nitrososphaerales archaeon]|nr:DUF998 domain-containing protein [Nitrososphaerales archaeon]